MRYCLAICCLLFLYSDVQAQKTFETYFQALKQITVDTGITLTIDEPAQLDNTKPTQLLIFALPNGNTTAQSFGKKIKEGEDWHFDIQHIGAQTAFIRDADPQTNYIVVYAENNLKSWPAWRRKFAKADLEIAKLVEALYLRYQVYRPQLTLSGHSGGGSFIFGYINALQQLPAYIHRIGFLDATYAYETEKHQAKLQAWLKKGDKHLQVIAYNDSVVVYNGKPLVSPTGGTWYRSQLMATDLQPEFKLQLKDLSDRLTWSDRKRKIFFNLIKNPSAQIYHTVLVERNGFIQLVFGGTALENKHYQFWGDRVYQPYILP